MKVLLVNPPLILHNKKILPVVENLFYNSVPLGLCYLAATLRQEGIDARILDSPVEYKNLSDVLEYVKNYNPDIVGITSTTISFNSAVILAEKIKKNFYGKLIILGGAHVTANPDLIKKYNCFDIGVLREGEITLNEIVRKYKKHNWDKIKGIVYKNNSNMYFSGYRDYIDNLDSLPFPARDLVPIREYRPQPNDEKKIPKLSMATSRGCPYGCIFCDKGIFGYKYRSFSPHYIVSEMNHLQEEYNAEDIAFVDSTFFINLEKIKGVIKEIKRVDLKISWTCSIRANLVTKDLLKQMKEAGCWRVRLGVESGSAKVLKFIDKGVTRSQIKRAAEWADEIGLQPKGFFMIGHLVDDRRTINESMFFAKSLPFKDITVQVNTPMKNTKQYKIHREFGRLNTKNISNFSYWEPVFVPNKLTKRELVRLHRKFYRSFYLRPVTFYRHISCIHSLYDFKKYIRSLRLIFNLLFSKL